MISQFEEVAAFGTEFVGRLHALRKPVAAKLFGSAAIVLRSASLAWWERFNRKILGDIDIVVPRIQIKRFETFLADTGYVPVEGERFFRASRGRIEARHIATGVSVEIWQAPLTFSLPVLLSAKLQSGDGAFSLQDLLFCKLAYQNPKQTDILDLLVLLEAVLVSRDREYLVETTSSVLAKDYRRFILASQCLNLAKQMVILAPEVDPRPYLQLADAISDTRKSLVWQVHRGIYKVFPNLRIGDTISDPDQDPWKNWKRAA